MGLLVDTINTMSDHQTTQLLLTIVLFSYQLDYYYLRQSNQLEADLLAEPGLCALLLQINTLEDNTLKK